MRGPAYGPTGRQKWRREISLLTPPPPSRLTNRHPTGSRPLSLRLSGMVQPEKERLDLPGHPEGSSCEGSSSSTSWYKRCELYEGAAKYVPIARDMEMMTLGQLQKIAAGKHCVSVRPEKKRHMVGQNCTATAGHADTY